MTKYQITAWCSFPHYATFEVEARSSREARWKAREQAPDEYAEPGNGGAVDWDEFEIYLEGDEAKSRTHFERSRRTEIAAEFALPVLELLACSSENRPERRAFDKLRRAINKATKP